MKTEFTNKTNGRNDESVLGVFVRLTRNGCCLQWTYPIGYSTVRIFEVPLYESFDEEKAVRGEYTEHTISSPEQNLDLNRLMNFAIFPVKETGELVRQDITTWCVTVTVIYETTVQTEIVKKSGLRGLFSQEEQITHRFLKIKSPITLPGRCILYSLKSIDGTFCLPFALEAGKAYTIPINENLELFTEEKFITLEKTNGMEGSR